MKNNSNVVMRVLTAGAAVVALILAIASIKLGSRQAQARSSFGQTRSAGNPNKQPSKPVTDYGAREPSIGLPRLETARGGIDVNSSHLARGEADYRAGRHAAAVPELKDAIKDDPKSSDAHYALALALTGTGKPKEAVEEYKLTIELASNDDPRVLAYYNMGNLYADLGEYERAIESYRDGLKLDPTLAKVHNNLGLAYAALKRAAEAASEFNQAVQLRSDYAEAHYNLGVAYLQLGKKQDAQQQQQILTKLKAELGAKLEALIKR
jgi:tetratricopeptide (TPR) repeat protein